MQKDSNTSDATEKSKCEMCILMIRSNRFLSGIGYFFLEAKAQKDGDIVYIYLQTFPPSQQENCRGLRQREFHRDPHIVVLFKERAQPYYVQSFKGILL